MSAVRAVTAIATRELRSLFLQPLAWVVMTALLLLNGLVFWNALAIFNLQGLPSSELVRFIFESLLFWLPLLIALPVIAMRLIAEERQSGTIETLLTTPVTETQVVVGKYAAALLFFVVLWTPLLAFVGLVEYYGDVDWRAAGSGFLGLVLTGGFLLSAALCASALTRNQIVAAVIGFVLVFGLFVLPLLAGFQAEGGPYESLFRHMDLYTAISEFARGIVRTSRVVYTVTGAAFFLFVAARLMEAFKGQ